MAYKALYRKYRPETFEDMVGQKHIVTTLQNAIKNNKIAHAYIFSGPRGTGKTTTAKLLAKALNCTSETDKPCNKCANCIAINEGLHPDIIEIDAASNNGVDQVRDLIDKVKYAPIEGIYKVYIIDEVHMMTSEAFNALLKTLEEPPAHAIFILATTDVHRVIPTILSRCQRFDFSKISYEDIKNRLIYILNEEKIEYEDKVPELIAELAEGGMRDALSILDQVASYAGNKINLQHIYDVYGIMSSHNMVDYLTLLSQRKTKETLEMIENFMAKGIDVKRLTYDLMVCLKDSIVFKSTSDESLLEKINRTLAKQVLSCYSSENILKVIDILNEAMSNYRQNTNYRLFFELASLQIIKLLSYDNKILDDEKVISEPKVVVEKNEEQIIQKQEVQEQIVQKEEPVQEVKNNLEESSQEQMSLDIPEEKPIVVSEPQARYSQPQDSEVINYSIDEYINIINQGDKHFKEELNSKWEIIKDYFSNPDTRYAVQILDGTSVAAANNEYIMIQYTFKLLSNRAKEKNNLLIIRKFIKEIFNYDLEVYVVDKNEFIDITRRYLDLRQAKRLPEKTPIPKMEMADNVDKIVENKVEKQNEIEDEATAQLATTLFGDDIEVEE